MADAILDSIRHHNRDRLASSQSWCLGVYWFIGIGMVAQTVLLAVLCAWSLPARWLSSFPNFHDPRVGTLYWLYPLLMLYFLLSAGAGMPGWMVTGTLYFVVAAILAIRGKYKVVVAKAEKKTGKRKGTRTGKDLEEEQQRVQHWVTIFPHRGVDTQYETKLRLVRFFARYNAASIDRVNDILGNYENCEARLFADLTKKYGPEPPDPAAIRAKAQNEAHDKAQAGAYGPAEESGQNWNRLPQPLSARQCVAVVVSFVVLVIAGAGIGCTLFLWQLPPYLIVQRPTPPTRSRRRRRNSSRR